MVRVCFIKITRHIPSKCCKINNIYLLPLKIYFGKIGMFLIGKLILSVQDLALKTDV